MRGWGGCSLPWVGWNRPQRPFYTMATFPRASKGAQNVQLCGPCNTMERKVCQNLGTGDILRGGTIFGGHRGAVARSDSGVSKRPLGQVEEYFERGQRVGSKVALVRWHQQLELWVDVARGQPSVTKGKGGEWHRS